MRAPGRHDGVDVGRGNGNALNGSSYRFVDNGKEATAAQSYYIEDIDIYGKVTRHGPIAVERQQRKPGAVDQEAPGEGKR